MKYINLFSLMLILLIAAGCSHETDYRISNSVFIEDDDHPGLPIYSEKGYNSFGVYWGLSPLTTQQPHDLSKIVVQNDSCHIHLSGSTGRSSHTLIISLSGYTPGAFTDLISLNGKEFDLTGSECSISLYPLNHWVQPTVFKILEGSFTIKRAQNMYVDKELQSVVLSGIFSFKATLDDEPVTFSDGRFDMRFGEENFFYLQEQK